MKADYEHFRPHFTHDTVVIFHDDDWAGVHRVITEKVANGDIAILQQADSLVVCRYTGAVQVKLNPGSVTITTEEPLGTEDVMVVTGDIMDTDPVKPKTVKKSPKKK